MSNDEKAYREKVSNLAVYLGYLFGIYWSTFGLFLGCLGYFWVPVWGTLGYFRAVLG